MAFGDVIGEAFVRVRPEMSGFRGDVQRNVRGGLHGVGGLIGGVLGLGIGFGIERELEKTIDKAKEAEVVQGQLRAAVIASGQSYDDLRDHIEEAIQAQSKMSSFEDEELFQSFTAIVRRVHDVNDSLRLNALAANVARGRNISLNQAALLIVRAYNGQTQSLRRLGIEVDKTTTVKEALALLDQKYGGAAAAYAETTAGKQEYLNKVLDDSREIIGGALLPVVSRLSEKFAEYLSRQNESGDLQRKVNSAVEEGARVAHALEAAFDGIRAVVGPLVNLIGGLGNAITLAIGVKLAAVITRGIGGFTALGASVATTTAEGVAEATAFGRAWDVAARNRTMTVTTIGPTGGPVGSGPIGPAEKPTSTGRKFFGAVGRGVAAYGPLVAYSVAIATLLRDTSGDPRRVGYVAHGLAHAGMAIFYHPRGGYFTFGLTDERVDRDTLIASNVLKSKAANAGPHRGVAPLPTQTSPDRTSRGGGNVARGQGQVTRLQNLRLQLAAADRRNDLEAEKRIQAQIVGIYQSRVDTTRATGKLLYRFKSELSTEQDKAAQIQDQIEQEAKSDAAAALARRQKASAARAKAIQKAAQQRDKQDAGVLRRLQHGRIPFERAAQRAADTEGTKDNIATAKALRDRIAAEIKVVKESVKNTQTKTAELDRLGDDYANAVTALNAAKKARAKALKEASTAAGTETRQDQLDKIIQIAELTDDPAALNRALDAAIANARKVLAKAQKAGKGVLDATLKLAQLQKQKRDALKDATSGNQGTTAYDLLQGFAQKFEGGNLINADQPFVGPSGFVADISQYLKRQPGVKYPSSTSTASTAATGQSAAVSAIDRLIAALDRNTSATGGKTGGVPAPKIPANRVVSRGGGRYYEAARARNNVETRGGI